MFNEPTNETTIAGDYYEFSLGGQADNDEPTHIGLHIITGDNRLTVALPIADAEVIGKVLVGHCDYVAGRPPREW